MSPYSIVNLQSPSPLAPISMNHNNIHPVAQVGNLRILQDILLSLIPQHLLCQVPNPSYYHLFPELKQHPSKWSYFLFVLQILSPQYRKINHLLMQMRLVCNFSVAFPLSICTNTIHSLALSSNSFLFCSLSDHPSFLLLSNTAP